MFISSDASPVGRRDHTGRLWQVLARDLELYVEDGWESVIHPLRIAASIEKVESSTDFVERETVGFCNPAANYEEVHSAFMSQYIAELTAMLWTWIAYENLNTILFPKNRKNPIDESVIDFIRKKMNFNSLPGLRKTEREAFEISQSSIFKSSFPKLHRKIRECWKPGNPENAYLYLRICRLTRNHMIHGNIDGGIPSPSNWDESTNYKPEEDGIVVFLTLVTQLILFAIQSLVYSKFCDESEITSEFLKDRMSEFLEDNEFESFNDVLEVCHLNDTDYDSRQKSLISSRK